MATKSKFVEEKINKLLLVNNEHNNEKENLSPTVKKLLNQQNNVQKLKNIFERPANKSPNNSNSSDDDNCAKIEKNSPKSPTSILTKAKHSFDCIRGMGSSTSLSSSLSSSPKKLSNKIDKIYDELIKKEREYIATLENGIENYVELIDKPNEFIEIPKEIFHEKFKLFGNIEEICTLHKLTILPEILSCENDVIQLAAMFIRLIENDTFYAYIKYAISHLHAKDMVTSQLQFFRKIQSLCHDRLGVQSFILQPIQKLPKYPLLIEEMIKTLSKNMHENKSALALLCVAKRKFEIYLDRMNQSLKLNDIVEAHQLSITLQYGVLTSLQIEFGVDVNEPSFLIVPSFSAFAEHLFQPPFNVFDLGKFIKTESHLECHEHNPYRFYYGEIFIFEKFLMYTKKGEIEGDKKALIYREKFKFGPKLSLTLKQDQRMLTLSDSYKTVSFIAHSIAKIKEINDLIVSFYEPRKSRDSAYFDEVFVTNSQEGANEELDNSREADKSKDNNDDENDEEEEWSSITNEDSSGYEYDSIDSEPDEGDKEKCIEISNSRFYVQSD